MARKLTPMMQGRFISQQYEVQAPAGTVLAELAELLVFDQRTRWLVMGGRGLTLGSPILALLVAMGGGGGEGMAFVLVWGWIIGIPMWIAARGRAIVPGRIPYVAAMIHTLCPDRRAPVQLRLDLREPRSDQNHSFDPSVAKHSWKQSWLQLMTDLGSGLTLSLNREVFQSEHETVQGAYRVRHRFATHMLQGSLRYPAAHFSALQAQGSQLCAYISQQLQPQVASSSVVKHEPGMVSISSGSVQPIGPEAAATIVAGQPAVSDDLRWLYAAWTAAATQAPWFSTATAGQYPAELAQAATAAAASTSASTKKVLPIVLAILAVLSFGNGALALKSALYFREAADESARGLGSPNPGLEAMVTENQVHAGVVLTLSVLFAAGAVAMFLLNRNKTTAASGS